MRQALLALVLLVASSIGVTCVALVAFFSIVNVPYTNLNYETTLSDFGNDLEALGFGLAKQPTSPTEAGEPVMVVDVQLHGCGIEIIRNVDQQVRLSASGGQTIEIYTVRLSQTGKDYVPYVSPRPTQVQAFLAEHQDRYSCYTSG